MDEPAFPLQDASTHQFHGISIRDYFAAKALNGLLACSSIGPGDGESLKGFSVRMAHRAYEYADAMLKAREVSE